MMVSLDGYFEGLNHDLSWHNVNDEFNKFAIAQLREADTILFGRRTYQLMENYWPSKAAIQDDPQVASLMNNTPKVVVSKTLEKVIETKNWKNITLITDNIKEEILKLKKQKGKDIILLASNNFSITLLKEGLLDEVRIMINPVVLGKGTPLFYGIKDKLNFRLFNTKIFNSGNVLLYYIPI